MLWSESAGSLLAPSSKSQLSSYFSYQNVQSVLSNTQVAYKRHAIVVNGR